MWKGKSVLARRIPLQPIIECGGVEVRLHGVDDFFGRVAVYFRACKVHFGADPVSQQMWRIRGFVQQVGPIDGRAALETFREVRACRQYERPAHAVAHSAQRRRICGRLPIDELEHGPGIAHHELDFKVPHHFKHSLHAFFVADHREFASLAVVQIRQHDVVADARDAARHIVQFFAFAGCIHVEEHYWKRLTFFRMDDERVHQPVLRFNVDVLFDHDRARSRRSEIGFRPGSIGRSVHRPNRSRA